MRFILFFVVFAALSVHAQQKLYISTRAGGQLNGGTILSVDPDGSNSEVVLNLGINLASPGYAGIGDHAAGSIIVEGPGGYLYGFGLRGNYGKGGIFKIKRDGTGYVQLLDFQDPGTSAATFGQTDGGLVLGPDGTLYGTTYNGGSNGAGMLFKITSDGNGYKNLFDFPSHSFPSSFASSLIFGNDGMLYGTHAGHYGVKALGIIYKIRPDGTDFTKLSDFSNTDAHELKSILMGADGKLYVVATGYSTFGDLLFSVNTDGSGPELIHTFASQSVNTGLIQGKDGRLYGTAEQHGLYDHGFVYSILPDGSDYVKLFDFNTADGTGPLTGLTQGPDNFLYGTTERGGTADKGVVFKLKGDGSAFQVLTNFASAQIYERSRLVVDDNGDVFGFNRSGGTNDMGFMYKAQNDGSAPLTLYDFSTQVGYGYLNSGGLTLGSNDHLYITWWQSAPPYPHKTSLVDITRETPPSVSIHELGSFSSSATSKVIDGKDGYWYGTIMFGGATAEGILFRVKADGSSYQVILNFTAATGSYPYGNPMLGKDGMIYGTCMQGGNNNAGTLWKANKDGTNYTVLRHFAFTDGYSPMTGVVQGNDGKLYGTTIFGTPGASIYKVNTDGTNFTKLHTIQQGEQGYADLLVLGNYLYGSVTTGGSDKLGTIIKIKRDGTEYSVVHDFNGTDGSKPFTSLIPYAGALYGATSEGGDHNFGTLFKINIDGSGFTNVLHFDHSTGGRPYNELVGICVAPPKPTITATAPDILTSNATMGNQWFRNGVLMPDETEQTIHVTTSGSYSVKVILGDCQSEASDEKVINITGIDEVQEQNSVSVHPNPVDDKVYITFDGISTSASMQIEISTMVGERILSYSGPFHQQWQCNLHPYQSGVYLFKIQVDQRTYYRKVIKE